MQSTGLLHSALTAHAPLWLTTPSSDVCPANLLFFQPFSSNSFFSFFPTVLADLKGAQVLVMCVCQVSAGQPAKKKKKSNMGLKESFNFLAKSPYIRDLAMLVCFFLFFLFFFCSLLHKL